MMMARPKTGGAGGVRAQRHAIRVAAREAKDLDRKMRGKKKRKGMMGCCIPTFATMGVICLMWLPKIFLTIGITFTIAGMVLMILGSLEHLRYDSGRISGAVLLGFGIVFVVISSIGLYMKRIMRTVADPDTGEQRIQFTADKKDIYQVEDDYRRPTSALSHTLPSAAKVNSAPSGGARPKTAVQNGRPATASTANGRPATASAANGRPATANAANGNVNMSNGRPSSAVVRIQNERAIPLSARSTGRPSSARSYASDSPKSIRPGSSSARPDSSRSRTSDSTLDTGTSPRSARSGFEGYEDDEIRISRDKPFVTRSSASLNSSLGSSGGLKAHVEIHAPPVINIISDTSFSNNGFEDDESISIHPMATLDPEAQEALARSAPPSPMFTPRRLQKEIVVSDELSDEDSV